MKRCPQCKKTYVDPTLNFCLDDGEWLIGAGVSDEPTTAILSGDEILSEAATRQQMTVTDETQAALPVSIPEHTAGGTKQRKRTIAIVAGAMVLIAAGISAWIYQSYGRGKESGVLSLQAAKFTRLTNTGQIAGGALSPDGKYLAQVVDDGSQQSLWLKQTAAASNVQIVPPAEVIYSGVSFAPDGNHIYYSVYEKGNAGTLYQVPVLGGQPRKLLAGINSGAAFSPDGRQIAFFRVRPSGSGESLFVANADGSGERELAVRSGDEEFFSGLFSTVSWSPDGKTIATPIRNLPENYLTVATVAVETGELRPATTNRWFILRQVAWLPDGDSILLSGAESSTAPSQIWQLSYPSGEVRQLTNDLNSLHGVGLTANADTIATVQAERTANIWVAPANDPARASKITSGRGFNREISWTPEGKIVYASNMDGNWELYITDTNGTEPSQLTTDALTDQFPFVTPDGRSIVFMSDRTGPPHIWRMDIDGSNQTQLTHEGYNVRPQVTADGRSIIFESSLGKGWGLWKIPIEGGQPVQLSDQLSNYPAISPDGKQIAVYYRAAANAAAKLAMLSSETGELIKVFDETITERESLNLDWTPDGKAVVYGVMKKGVGNLWAQPIAGGPPKQITNFTSDRIFWFKFSRDGKQLAVSRGTINRDVILIKNFR